MNKKINKEILIDQLTKQGKWKELLEDFCKENRLTINFIDIEDNRKCIEIYDLSNGEMINRLQSLGSEKDFNEISCAVLQFLVGE